MPRKEIRPYSIRYVIAHGRLLLSALVGAACYKLWPQDWGLPAHLTASWDAALALYMLLVLFMMARSPVSCIRSRAAEQDEGRVTTLFLSVLAAMASLVAIAAQLAEAKDMADAEKFLHVGMAALTLLLSWFFMQTIFAVHYAHEYYMPDNDTHVGGLNFPPHEKRRNESPDYWDFLYFSCTIGTSTATSDIEICARSLRRIAGVHAVLAFFFNTVIMALAINMAAGLI